MKINKILEDKLNKAFSPLFLEIVDLSHLHKGHAGHSPSGESHFKITIKSSLFQGKSRLDRHQLVYQVLEEEIKRIHALELVLKSPDEASYSGR